MTIAMAIETLSKIFVWSRAPGSKSINASGLTPMYEKLRLIEAYKVGHVCLFSRSSSFRVIDQSIFQTLTSNNSRTARPILTLLCFLEPPKGVLQRPHNDFNLVGQVK